LAGYQPRTQKSFDNEYNQYLSVLTLLISLTLPTLCYHKVMIVNSVKKLIDEAIVPAVLLILAKMVGLLLSSYFFKLPFEIKNGGFLGILPSIRFLSLKDYVVAENYSNLAMLLAAAAGTLIVLIRLHFLHESHIEPKMQSKLASFNLEKIITSSYTLYHTALTWLIFLWLTVAFLAVSTFFKITNVQVSILAVIIAVNFTWIVALDVQKEVEISQS